jgi:hypothetical protein
MLKKQVGVEAECFILDKKGDPIIVPSYMGRDDFPVLGEIRGEPGENVATVIANFHKEMIEFEGRIYDDHSMAMLPVKRVRLKTYRKAMAEMRGNEKFANLGKIHNVNGVDISEYSDQVISKGKIQGVNASCGLHIHFSCEDSEEVEVEERKFKPVYLPIKFHGQIKGALETLDDLTLELYRDEGYEVTKTLKAMSSQLNRPTIEYIVREMDKAFFERFAPPEKERTKYRQAGFYETKEHGFEYRSLPATNETINALPEIVRKAFDLLNSLWKW